MKRVILLIAAAILAVGSMSTVEAGNLEDQEFRHIILLLKDGSRVDGYIYKGWGPRPAYLDKKPYKIKIVPQPDSKDVAEYIVSDIDRLLFVEATERFPEGECWETTNFSQPTVYNGGKKSRPVLMRVEARNPFCTVYFCQSYGSTGGRNSKTTIVDVSCVCFKDTDSFTYIYGGMYFSTMIYGLKRKNPELAEALKVYYDKGDEHKMHRRELKQDPVASLLTFAERFFTGTLK